MEYFDKAFWEKWANENYDEFTSLKDGAKIAMLVPNTENLIVLEKESKISVRIDDRNLFDFPFAEIAFKFSEENIDEVLNDSTLDTLKNLTKKDEIGILAFVNHEVLNKYQYNDFLKKFGFEISSGCSCGCC